MHKEFSFSELEEQEWFWRKTEFAQPQKSLDVWLLYNPEL